MGQIPALSRFPIARVALSWLFVSSLALWPMLAFGVLEPPLRGVGFDETLAEPVVLTDELLAAHLSSIGVPLNVRLTVKRADVEPQPGVYDFEALDARLELYERREGLRTYLDLRDSVSPAPEMLEGWGQFVRAITSRYRGRVRGCIFGISTREDGRPAAREYAFYVKSTVVNIRSGDDGASAILGGVNDSDAAWLESLYGEDVAAYVDAIGLEPSSANTTILALVEKYDSAAGVILLGVPLGEDPSVGSRRFMERHLDILGTRISGVTYSASGSVIAAVLPVMASLRGMLTQELVSLDEKAAGLRLTRRGEDVTSAVPHRLLFGLGTSTSYFIYSAPEGPLELVLSERTGARPVIVDALRNRRQPARSFSYDASVPTARMELPGESWPLLVDWATGEGTNYSAMEEVSSTVLPTVAEIIARHQQAQAAQDALLSSYIANATMEQHFRPTSSDPGFDVVTENRFFVEGKNTEWEELSFRLNGTRWGSNRPPFPILQAEKVLSLPLDLRLNTDYRYRLERVEPVKGRESFVVRFDPIDEKPSFYRGTVWIDRETYLKAKTQTVQTRLSAPIVSSEEVQHFSPVGVVGVREVQLLTELVGRQIMLIAGRNILVEREVRFEGFQLNPADFQALRQASRSSDNVMYRDTDQGLRYLVKRDGERTVQSEETTSTAAALVGVTYDPSYDYPLPLMGISYLDFEFLGEDNQLAVLFGGVLALVNVQRPKLLGERVDGSFDLFAIAVRGSDRVYDRAGELEDQRLETLPFNTGLNVGWQVAEFHRLVASYQLRRDDFSQADTTQAAFRPPVSTLTNGLGLSWEWKRLGYSLAVGGTSYQRAEWRLWGNPGDYQPAHKDYLKYSASLTKDFFFGFHKIHLNAAYFGGSDLDRFSKYQFGFFDDNRVHGVPSSGVRFSELGMLRGSYSFNLFDQYRLDLFLDQALGSDAGPAAEWHSLTGVGIGFNMRGPWNTLIRGEAGKSFLPQQYREPGSVVFQIQILKPL